MMALIWLVIVLQENQHWSDENITSGVKNKLKADSSHHLVLEEIALFCQNTSVFTQTFQVVQSL